MSQQEQRLTAAQIANIEELLEKGELLSEEEQNNISLGFVSLKEYMDANKENVEKGENLQEINEELGQRWQKSRASIENAKYTLIFNEDESRFIKDLIEKVEFNNPEDLFTTEEVIEEVLNQHPKVKYPLVEDLKYLADIRQVTKFYHFLTLYKAKGANNKSTQVYSALLKKTGQFSLIFSYFNQISRDLSQTVYSFTLAASKKEEVVDAETPVDIDTNESTDSLI